MPKSDFAEVAAVIADYFDGLYNSDAALLGEVFHPKATYACATEGKLTYMTMEDYLPMVAKRPSPASKGETRKDAIEAIEFAGPVTAFVRARCSIAPRDFTDFLTLIHIDGRWRIIAKVFHFETADDRG